MRFVRRFARTAVPQVLVLACSPDESSERTRLLLRKGTIGPEGDFVECFEVLGRDHPRFADFRVRSLAGGRVDFDVGKRDRFLSSRAARSASCSTCFTFRHCGGYCESRALKAGAGYPFRREVKRKIALGLIAMYITEGDGTCRGSLRQAHARPCAQCGR